MRPTELIQVAAVLGVVLAIWWPIRVVIAQRLERSFELAHRRNADGVIIGAEPIHLRGVRPGAILLLHGYNDSPQAMAPLASALHDAGWTVDVPLLPGHGRSLQEFERSGAREWIDAAAVAYRRLGERHADIAVCGMSMGGALAFLLAAQHEAIRAVIGIAPYLYLSRATEVLLSLARISVIGAKYVTRGGGRSLHDPIAAAKIIAYRASTPRLLRELARVTRAANDALPSVRQPVLVVQSRSDNRIPVRSAARAFRQIGSSDKTIDWVTGAGHVLTLDYGHQAMEERIAAWLATRFA